MSLEAGYYPSVEISTTLNPTGNVTYTHHIHSLTTTTATEDNDQAASDSVSGGYSDSYVATSSGGCFTKYVANYQTCSHNITGVSGTSGSSGDCSVCHSWHDNSPVSVTYGSGSVCGQTVTIDHTHGWSNTYTHQVLVSSGYTATCGYTNGQIIKATIEY